MGKNVIELDFNAANQLVGFDADATIKVGSINNNILSIAGPYSTTNALLTSYLLANGNTVDRKRAKLTSDTREVEGETYPVWTYTLEPAIVNAVGSKQAIELFVTVIEDTIVLDVNAITDKGTFGNAEADVLDVPATADEGDYYTCQQDNYLSFNAGLIVFQRLDIALFNGGVWANSTIFINNNATDKVELTVSGGFIDQTQTQEVTQTDLVLDDLQGNDNDILNLQRGKIDKDIQGKEQISALNPLVTFIAVNDGTFDEFGIPNIKALLADVILSASNFDRGETIDIAALLAKDPNGTGVEGWFATVINPTLPQTLDDEKWLYTSGVWTATGKQKDATIADINNLQLQIGNLLNLSSELTGAERDNLVNAINGVLAQKGLALGITPLTSSATIDTLYFQDIVLLRAGTIGSTGDITVLPITDVKRGTFYTFIDNVPFTETATGLVFRSKGEIVYNNAIATDPVEWLQISGATVFSVNDVLPDSGGNIQLAIADIATLQTQLDAKFLKADLVGNLDNPLSTQALDTLTLKNELDAKANASDNNSVTGILTMPSAVINSGDNTAIDVGAGKFKFVKFVGNNRITVTIDTVPETISIQNIATTNVSMLYYTLDENDNAILGTDNGTLDAEQSPIKAYFALVLHQGGVILRVQPEGRFATAYGDSLYNIVYPSHNNANLEGNNYSGVIALRQVQVTAGKIFGFGYNGRIDATRPDITTQTAESPDEYIFTWRDGTGGITIRPETTLTTDYDPNGDGTLVPATGTANTALIYYVFRSGKINPDIPAQTAFETFILAPQTTYDTMGLAKTAFELGEVPVDNIPESLIDTVTWRYVVIVRNSGTDFSIETDAEFIEITDDVAGLGGGVVSSLNASQIVNDSAQASNLARGANLRDVTDSLDAEDNFYHKTSSATYNGTGSYTLDDVFDVKSEYYFDVKFPVSGDTDLAKMTITGFIVDAPIIDRFNNQLTVAQISSYLVDANPYARLLYDGTSFIFQEFDNETINNKKDAFDPSWTDEEQQQFYPNFKALHAPVTSQLNNDTDIFPQFLVTPDVGSSIDAKVPILEATQLAINGGVDDTVLDATTRRMYLEDDGTLSNPGNNNYNAARQVLSIISGHKYYVRHKTIGPGTAREEIGFLYTDDSTDTVGTTTSSADYSGIITATKTDDANFYIVQKNDGDITKIEMYTVDITGTPYENLTVSQLDDLLPYFDGTAKTDFNLISRGKNILDSTRMEEGRINGTDGTDLVDANAMRSIDFIVVNSDTDYNGSITVGDGIGFYWYDVNGVFISNETSTGVSTFSALSPSNARLLRFVVFEPLSTLPASLLQLELGTVASSFEQYKLPDTNPITEETVNNIEPNSVEWLGGDIHVEITTGAIGGITNYLVPISLNSKADANAESSRSNRVDINNLREDVETKKFDKTGGVITGDVDIDNNDLIGVNKIIGENSANSIDFDGTGQPSEESIDIHTRGQLFFKLDFFGKAPRFTQGGVFDMDNSKIQNVADPTVAQDVVTKNYADNNYINKDGTTAFTGNQSMGSNKLTNVSDPTLVQDAATKNYVDGTNVGGSVTAGTTITINYSRAYVIGNVAHVMIEFVTSSATLSDSNVLLTLPSEFANPLSNTPVWIIGGEGTTPSSENFYIPAGTSQIINSSNIFNTKFYSATISYIVS